MPHALEPLLPVTITLDTDKAHCPYLLFHLSEINLLLYVHFEAHGIVRHNREVSLYSLPKFLKW